MELGQYVVDGLTHRPVQAQLAWTAKLRATRPPDYLPATEYKLNGVFTAGAPFLPVWLVSSPADERREPGLEYARTWRRDAASAMGVMLLYLGDWSQADGLTLGLGAVGGGLESPATLLTGVVYDWALEPGGPYPLRKLLLAALEDTQNVRGRWRIRPERQAGLPAWLSFLRQGRCAGRV